MDKVQKIREKVEKRYECWKEKESNSHSIESEIRMSECQHLLLMLDSLQEEPVSEDLGKENKIEILADIIFNAAKHGYMPYDTQDEYCAMEIAKRYIDKFIVTKKQENPVSEDLEEVANKYGKDTFVNECMENGVCDNYDLADAFKAGAKWQKQQDEKTIIDIESVAYANGMAAMKQQMQSTIELAEDHAMLAGMEKMKEQMMARAIDAHCFGFQGAALFSFKLPASNYLVGSEVKVVVIKED